MAVFDTIKNLATTWRDRAAFMDDGRSATRDNVRADVFRECARQLDEIVALEQADVVTRVAETFADDLPRRVIRHVISDALVDVKVERS